MLIDGNKAIATLSGKVIENGIEKISREIVILPNNDGLNDTWDLSNLNIEKAQIFNRYGLEIYSKSNYIDEWDGRADNGNELPTATYYYVLTFPNGIVKTGWVYLNREN